MLSRIKDVFSSNPVSQKHELNHDDIMRGLRKVSKKIGQLRPDRLSNNDPIVLVAAGGVTSVLVLGNRLSTKDVDFFHMDYAVVEEISAATDLLQSGSLKNFPPGWLNSEMLAYVLNNDGCEDLFQNSIQQNLVLFESPSLVVYAVDWKFQLVNKIIKAWQIHAMGMTMTDGSEHKLINVREKNLLDAVYILHYLTQQRQGIPLRFSEMTTWYFYGPTLETHELDFVNQAYCLSIEREDPNYLPISTTT